MGKQVIIPGADFSTVSIQPTKVLNSIAITTAPTKTSYTVGELFNPAGMVVTATYTDTTTSTQIAYTYSPQQFLSAGNPVTVTIAHSYNGVTKTATQNVTVIAST